jgi:hypothetical protein
MVEWVEQVESVELDRVPALPLFEPAYSTY